MRKPQKNTDWETFYKIAGQYFQKCQGLEREGKTEEMPQIRGD